jgi:hypothetical protein
MTPKRIALIATAAAALLVGFYLWWSSPERALKRRTADFLETVSIGPDTNRAMRQLRTYALNRLLAAEVTLDTPDIPQANGTFERAELESAFSWIGNQAREATFALEYFGDVAVEKDRGQVALVLNALVDLGSSRPADGRYDVTFHWREIDDEWRLERAEWRRK